ncbi:helix-turn-helix transcriptional regulator [Streptomyces sp. NPDC005435]|uniref:helix-turn-helix domain-containing protein n=1 Tax=Streptomyces sp. NPDC005435 TaxID=3154464 RepID=UPI00345591DD
MHAAADASQADGLAAMMAEIDELLSVLRMSREDIDLDDLSYQSGLPADRVRALLDGAEVGPENLEERFQQRLVFLRQTRLKPGGKRFTLDEIAAGAGISHGQVGYLLNGERRPGFTVLAGLERFFDVPPGFFTATERQALHRALKPVRESLTHLALLKGKGIHQLALRSGDFHGASTRLGHELRAALETALSQPEPPVEDPEMRELTDTITALPVKSRRRIMPLIQDLLGLVRSDGPEED